VLPCLKTFGFFLDEHDLVFQPLWSSLKFQIWFSLLVLYKVINILPVRVMSCGDRPFRLRLVVHVQISAIIPQFSHPLMHSIYVHNIFTIENQ
jgi:hypothetical protein